jgi:RNA polymerase sigma factor (sigma-70 family)
VGPLAKLAIVDERELLTEWAAGNSKAGEQLFARYYPLLTRFFANKVRSLDDVQELLQRTFVGALEGAPRFRAESDVRAWMYGIARNHLRRWYAERRRDPNLGLDSFSVADEFPGPSTLMRGKSELRLLATALRSIPLESQLALELFYWERMSAGQIGEVLEMPEGTVRSRLRKARSELELALKRLAASPAELESTISNLDDWARDLRDAWGV